MAEDVAEEIKKEIERIRGCGKPDCCVRASRGEDIPCICSVFCECGPMCCGCESIN